ncbi:MAG TPA: type II secretion system protein N [Sedimentisphaerales bacterium]|nr:type II secretion system protein N [Sedimentisphaerales bacterium]
MKKGDKIYIPRLLFITKSALVLVLAYVLVRTFMLPRHAGRILVPTSTLGTENVTAVEATGSQGARVQEYSAIISQNIFGDANGALRGNVPIGGSAAGSVAQSTEKELGLALVGTVAGSSALARAIVKDLQTNKLGLYKIGDTVSDSHIEGIEENAVVLIHRGQRKILNLGARPSPQLAADNAQIPSSRNGTPAPKAAETGSPVMTRPPVESGRQDIEAILKEAAIQPYAAGGQIEGLRITGLENVQWAKDFPLKNGDVVRTVNGQRLTSKQKAYQVFKKVRSQPAVNIELLRDDKITTLSFASK